MITSFLRTWRFILNHPLASRNLPEAIKLWFKWQVGSRILKMPVVVPFVGDSQLVAELGMTGATGNIYTGLHEFTDMAFCLHLLRASDCLLAVLLETVDPSIEKTLRESGFQPGNYDPFKRELKTSAHNHLSNNYLWIRNLSKVEDRCKTAPQYQVLGVDF